MMIRIEPSRDNKVFTINGRIIVLIKPVHRPKVFY